MKNIINQKKKLGIVGVAFLIFFLSILAPSAVINGKIESSENSNPQLLLYIGGGSPSDFIACGTCSGTFTYNLTINSVGITTYNTVTLSCDMAGICSPVGNYTYTANNETNFNQIVTFLTNGIDDQMELKLRIPGGSSSWTWGNESERMKTGIMTGKLEYIGEGPDLAGCQIDYIRLNLKMFEVENSRLYEIAVWEVWGHPPSEWTQTTTTTTTTSATTTPTTTSTTTPSWTTLLLLLSLFAILSWRQQKKKS